MTDYIERDELVSYFKEIATKTLRDGSVQCVLGAGVIAHMIVEIKEFPAADVRPVRRGRWVQHQNSTEHMVCSACNRTWHNLWCPNVMFDYCPNCGAEMVTDCHQLEEGET